jgi:hypothetical protein
MEDDKQKKLFDIPEWWEEHWEGMPEFIQEDLTPEKSIFVHFENYEDMKKFSKLVDQKITAKTQSIWYPKAKIRSYKGKAYATEGYKKHES